MDQILDFVKANPILVLVVVALVLFKGDVSKLLEFIVGWLNPKPPTTTPGPTPGPSPVPAPDWNPLIQAIMQLLPVILPLIVKEVREAERLAARDAALTKDVSQPCKT